jgi:thiol-disulfide isomerase/thioredoxin
MRFTLPVALFLCHSTLHAQSFKVPETEEGAEHDSHAAKLSPKKAALEELLTERSSDEAFQKAIKDAKANGIGEQAILEARFLYLVDQHQDEKLVDMLPEFMERDKNFKVEDSEIFSVKEDWQAVLEYIQALAALKKNDRDAFKKHVTEAFWLSPKQAEVLAPHIEKLRQEDAMRDLKVDLASKYKPLGDGNEMSLGEIGKEKKAVLIHFWSPWIEDGQHSIEDFKVVAKELLKNGLGVASILANASEDSIRDAKEMYTSMGDQPPGVWLMAPEKSPLVRNLRIQNLPTMVLVQPDGKILYNGDPSDDSFWEALKKISPEIKRPGFDSE